MLTFCFWGVYAEPQQQQKGNLVALEHDVLSVEQQKNTHRRSRKPGVIGSYFSSPVLHIKNMTYEQLSERVPELVSEGSLRVAGKYLKRMLVENTDPDERGLIIAQIADLLFQRGKYEKALKWYRELVTTYPGHMKYEYAAWRACEAAEKCINTFDRCQEKNHLAIRLCDEYLAHTGFCAYRREVQTIRDCCYKVLVHSEMSIWSECLKLNNETGAAAHLAYVEQDLTTVYPPAVLLAQSYKERQTLDAVLEHVQDSPSATAVAQRKPHMADRF
jgi:tetratricopeptide (TPR) repeat protein